MQQTKPTLVIGATTNPARFAYIATEMLMEYQHPVVLYGVRRGAVNGITIQNEWPNHADIDTVTLYINAKRQVEYEEKILALKPKRIIFNPGTENPTLQRRALAANIEAINACTLVMLRTGQY